MSVSRDEVLRVAKLARLKLSESDLQRLELRFAQVLKHFDVLSELDTSAVEPLYHAAEQMELRPDEPEAPILTEELLQNAPEHFENCFKIPRVVGGEE